MKARIARFWSSGVSQIRVRTSQQSAGLRARAGFEAVEGEVNGFAPWIDEVTMLLRQAGGSKE